MMPTSPLKFTDHLNEPIVHVASKVIAVLMSNHQPNMSHRKYNLHRSLLAGELKLGVILVRQSSVQVTKKACACMNGGYQAIYPLRCGLGMRLV